MVNAAVAVPDMEGEDATSVTWGDAMGHCVASCVNDSVCSMWGFCVEQGFAFLLPFIRDHQQRFSVRFNFAPA